MARFIKCGTLIIQVEKVNLMEETENGIRFSFPGEEEALFPNINIDEIEAALRNSDTVVEVFQPASEL